MTDLPSASLDFLVRKDDLRTTRFDAADPPEPAPGQALLRVDRFAFTANNVTYAAIGEPLGYWKFFPAPEGWGRVPVWGYGDVVGSRAAGVAEGERVFGYFPMSSHLRVQPRAGAGGFADAAPHRAGLPPVYNRYLSTRANPRYRPEREDHEMILFPLFMTSFVLDDYLADRGFFGAKLAVFSSASSKTALGTASLLAGRGRGRPRIVGLTSPANRSFVEKLGCYDEVRTYDAIASLPAGQPALFVDFAGNRQVVASVHERLGRDLQQSIAVGATHWERTGGGGPLLGPAPAVFFAPTWIEKRSREWGAAGVGQRFGEAWDELVAESDGWLRIERQRGPEAVERVYRQTLEGRIQPDLGQVLSL